jgi:hypothetical protein
MSLFRDGFIACLALIEMGVFTCKPQLTESSGRRAPGLSATPTFHKDFSEKCRA